MHLYAQSGCGTNMRQCQQIAPHRSMCCCHYQLHVLLPAAPAPVTKRLAAQPRAGYMLTNVKPETITAIPYDIIKEGLQ